MSKTVPQTTNCFPDVAPEPSAETLLDLGADDRITGCFAVWAVCDRMAEELARCHVCEQPTFRVVAITSAAHLERRSPLCCHHFILVTRSFPELKRASAAEPSQSELRG